MQTNVCTQFYYNHNNTTTHQLLHVGPKHVGAGVL